MPRRLREMTFTVLKDSLTESAVTTASLLLIVIGAAMFARFMAVSGVPTQLGRIIENLDLGLYAFMLIVAVIYLILGMFLEGIGIMMLTLPILLPIANAMDIDLVWLGVVVVKLTLLGLITPPVGLQAFVVKGVIGDGIALGTIFRGLVWFLGVEVVLLALLIVFPDLSLWLPRVVYGE